MAKDKLTGRMERFAEEYIKDLNGKRAAIAAGYAPSAAEVTASRLLKKGKVADRVRKLKAERSERTAIDSDWLLRRLAEEAEADIADLYDEDGNLRPVSEWPTIWRQGLVQGIDVEEVNESGVKMGEIKKIKLSDRVRRLELIGKHVNVRAFSEQIDVEVNDRAAIIARARARAAKRES